MASDKIWPTVSPNLIRSWSSMRAACLAWRNAAVQAPRVSRQPDVDILIISRIPTSGGWTWAWPYGTSRRAADCPAVDAWGVSVQACSPVVHPEPQDDCPARFGNSDIFPGSFPDPTL
jgi:hypothetical protein